MAKNINDNESYEQIAEWLEIYHSNSPAREKKKAQTLIVSSMIPVVKRIARTIARRAYDPIEDLVQAGFIGLLKAIDRYSKDRNDNFKVYAGFLIIGEMKHYIRDKLNAIRVPRYIQELTIRINNFTKDLTVEEVQSLTTEEVASALEVSQKAVNYAMEAERRGTTISLEELFSGNSEDNLSYEEVLAPKNHEELAEFEDSRIIFEDVITKLPPDEQVVIDMYYKQNMTKKEIADALLISPISVTRLMKQAFAIIAEKVADKSMEQHNCEG